MNEKQHREQGTGDRTRKEPRKTKNIEDSRKREEEGDGGKVRDAQKRCRKT